MPKRQLSIECGRCGATKLEGLAEDEANGLTEEMRPIYRLCERCERTTGWIKAKGQSPLAEEKLVEAR